jgi:ribosomal protein S27AE
MEATLQSIFLSEFEGYKKFHGLSIDQLNAAQAIIACQSEALGYEEWICRNGDHSNRQYHSCRNRSCPRCSGSHQADWLEKIKNKLLPCDHYHVVFTLPHELNAIWHFNRSWCTEKLFQATTETLKALLNDERYLGGEVGLISSLHTWGRSLIFHPHMHVLVTGQGLRGEETVRSKKDFLLPVGIIKAKFRGKWLSWLNHGYEKGEIRLPEGWSELDWRKTLRTVARKQWNIRIQGAYPHGEGVAIYLSRYIKGGPIKDSNILEADCKTVSFRYKDYHCGRHRTMLIKTTDFITRVLWHVAVKGQHQVRYYGLYSSGARDKRNLIRQCLESDLEQDYQKRDKEPRQCPKCGAKMIHILSARREISYIRNRREILVQQHVTADRDRQVPSRDEHTTDPPVPFFCAVRRPLN